MPGTYSQLLLHVVTSTKGRRPWISTAVAERLYPYVGGIVRSEKGVLYEIGGVEDHVHLYLRWRPDSTVSDLMRKVKSGSSKWIHETFPELGQRFAWQEAGAPAPPAAGGGVLSQVSRLDQRLACWRGLTEAGLMPSSQQR